MPCWPRSSIRKAVDSTTRILRASRRFSSCQTRRYTRTFSRAVLQTTPPPPPSSTASARVIVLTPEPSRLLILWWLALHGLLLGAVALVGADLWLKGLFALGVVVHGISRRPAAAPTPILVAEDGSFHVPMLETAWLVPGPRTRLAARWLRLSLLGGARPHDILLCVDQVDAASWARVNARLRHGPAVGNAGGV